MKCFLLCLSVLFLNSCGSASASKKSPHEVSESEITTRHELRLSDYREDESFKINFAQNLDPQPNVIALYITNCRDEIPTFPDFEFSGKVYWMIYGKNFLKDFIQLPVEYGTLPPATIDMTPAFKGPAGGIKLKDIARPACLKVSLISHEPEGANAPADAFKVSVFNIDLT